MASSMYIHIPFCKTICRYCDFCKMYSKDEWISEYLKALYEEIDSYYRGEKLRTIYIGGGTPNSLNDRDFEVLLQLVDTLLKDSTYEYTIECNVELLTENQVRLMKKYGVNRVSLGVQTFEEKFMTFLNRTHTKVEVRDKITLLKEYGITNINVDLMYAFPLETMEDLKRDIEVFLTLDVPHISTYSLMIEHHTILYTEGVSPIDEELDAEMYNVILDMLPEYNHYEVSNFAKEGYESKHNLTYWNNKEYYGFGLSASGYVDGVRYTNTKNLKKYINKEYRGEEHLLSKQETMENEMILGLRKMEGVSLSKFYRTYGIKIEDAFDILDLLKQEKLLISGDYIKINNRYIYISNDILLYFIY